MGEREISERPIEILISTELFDIPAKEHYLVSEEILKKITGLGAPSGLAAEVSMPEPQDLRAKKKVLILDRLADPGNLGTLLRSALAFGWEGVIVTPNTVDLFNDKALRAGKGAIFHLPYMRMQEAELIEWAKHVHVYVADTEGMALGKIKPQEPFALVLSSEAEGPDPWTESAGKKITIPMKKGVESLNVAASGAILLYQFTVKEF